MTMNSQNFVEISTKVWSPWDLNLKGAKREVSVKEFVSIIIYLIELIFF